MLFSLERRKRLSNLPTAYGFPEPSHDPRLSDSRETPREFLLPVYLIFQDGRARRGTTGGWTADPETEAPKPVLGLVGKKVGGRSRDRGNSRVAMAIGVIEVIALARRGSSASRLAVLGDTVPRLLVKRA